jgi:hypothetical protein
VIVHLVGVLSHFNHSVCEWDMKSLGNAVKNQLCI